MKNYLILNNSVEERQDFLNTPLKELKGHGTNWKRGHDTEIELVNFYD